MQADAIDEPRLAALGAAEVELLDPRLGIRDRSQRPRAGFVGGVVGIFDRKNRQDRIADVL